MAEAQPVIDEWRRMGYHVALWRNGTEWDKPIDADFVRASPEYHGWGPSINELIRDVIQIDRHAEWFVGGGDDTYPDQQFNPLQIASECTEHFGGTNGVMQPIGDLKDWPNSHIDRFAGSPWIGKEFALRALGGKGPFHPELHHMFGDEFLQVYAEHLGVFWQRPDLTHRHQHWMREGQRSQPPHLKAVNTSAHWNASKEIFARLKADVLAGRIK